MDGERSTLADGCIRLQYDVNSTGLSSPALHMIPTYFKLPVMCWQNSKAFCALRVVQTHK